MSAAALGGGGGNSVCAAAGTAVHMKIDNYYRENVWEGKIFYPDARELLSAQVDLTALTLEAMKRYGLITPMKTPKIKKIKVPKLKAPVLTALLASLVTAGEKPAVKSLTEKNGLFTARNERGDIVAIFGHHFARNIETYAKLITPQGSGFFPHVMGAPEPQAQNIQSLPPPPSRPRRLITYLVVAQSLDQYQEFCDGHARRNPCVDLRFRYITHLADLLGYRLNDDTRLMRLPGWSTVHSAEFVRSLNEFRCKEYRWQQATR